MRKVTIGILVAALAVATLAPLTPARAAVTEITMEGTLFLSPRTTLPAGSDLSFVNAEPMDYPTLIGKHNIVADSELAGLTGATAWPFSGPMQKIGERWTCMATAGGVRCLDGANRPKTVPRGTYAFKCGLHPDRMRALLVIE